MSDQPTLTSMLASIVRENRPGRTVRLVDPVRTHGHNELKRAYVYALLAHVLARHTFVILRRSPFTELLASTCAFNSSICPGACCWHGVALRGSHANVRRTDGGAHGQFIL